MHAFFFRHGLGHFIEEELKDNRTNPIDNETEERATLRSNGANDILPDVITQIEDGAAFAWLPIFLTGNFF
jgi:hypothetical protein